MNFKCVYSNQFKKYECIQGIWEIKNFMKNTMVKFVLARAEVRTDRIFCLLDHNLMCLEHLQRYAFWRAPRAEVRARQIFFMNVNFVKKSRCNFFGLLIAQKAKILEVFEVLRFF